MQAAQISRYSRILDMLQWMQRLLLKNQSIFPLEKQRQCHQLLSLNAGPNARFASQSADWSTGKRILFALLGAPFDGLAKSQSKSYDFIYVQPNGKQLAAFTKYLEEANIKPVIDSVYPFDQVNAAIAKIATGHSQGKVILKVDDEE